MAARLKVFLTSDGLTDFVVAATSKPKALAAWGSHQDLFKTGLAHETDDPALVKAATAAPGAVLRRPASGRGKLARLKPKAPAKAKGPSEAALKTVADLEAKLKEVARDHEAAIADLQRRLAEAEDHYQAVRAGLEARLSAAKRALGS